MPAPRRPIQYSYRWSYRPSGVWTHWYFSRPGDQRCDPGPRPPLGL